MNRFQTIDYTDGGTPLQPTTQSCQSPRLPYMPSQARMAAIDAGQRLQATVSLPFSLFNNTRVMNVPGWPKHLMAEVWLRLFP
jgi:hypothetical protein